MFGLKGYWESLWLADEDTLQNATLLGREKKKKKEWGFVGWVVMKRRESSMVEVVLANGSEEVTKGGWGGVSGSGFSLKKMEGMWEKRGANDGFFKGEMRERVYFGR